MNFEEWLKATEFGLKRRYKIKDMIYNSIVGVKLADGRRINRC